MSESQDIQIYNREVVEHVLMMYLTGMPIYDIAAYYEGEFSMVNSIIDRYAPYL